MVGQREDKAVASTECLGEEGALCVRGQEVIGAGNTDDEYNMGNVVDVAVEVSAVERVK